MITEQAQQLDLLSYQPAAQPAAPALRASSAPGIPLATWTAAGPVVLLFARRGKELKADAVHFAIPGRAEPFHVALRPLRTFCQSLAEQRMLVRLAYDAQADVITISYRRPERERPAGQATLKDWAWLERYHSPHHPQEKRARTIRLYA